MRISDLGEQPLIHKIRARFPGVGATLGIGDDAAIVEVPAGHSIVYCSDLVAENTHFIRNLHPADSVGYKVVAVNVSDVGAMGGVPMFFTLSIALPGDLDAAWFDRFLDGMARACSEFTVSLVGGDSSSAERIFADVSMIGRVRTGLAVRRSGAKPGDGIYVTGSLGGSALGLDRLRAGDIEHASVKRHLYPSPRHRVGLALAGSAHAMIDVSDGLSTDLSHILEESKVSARIDKKLIPIAPDASVEQAIHGGEEYELLIVAPELPTEVDGIPIQRIGEIARLTSTSPQITLMDGSRDRLLRPGGYQHF